MVWSQIQGKNIFAQFVHVYSSVVCSLHCSEPHIQSDRWFLWICIFSLFVSEPLVWLVSLATAVQLHPVGFKQPTPHLLHHFYLPVNGGGKSRFPNNKNFCHKKAALSPSSINLSFCWQNDLLTFWKCFYFMLLMCSLSKHVLFVNWTFTKPFPIK